MFEPHEHLFPKADDPAVRPFAVPFLELMFAHANFEEVFRDLQNVVTKDDTYSRTNRWTAKKRPAEMRRLMTEHGCRDEEISTAIRVLTDVLPFCNDRNLLAHGDWWKFDQTSREISVRGDQEREGEERSRNFTPETLTAIAARFDEFEMELWRLRREIELRST
jgi:hypothetical protein